MFEPPKIADASPSTRPYIRRSASRAPLALADPRRFIEGVRDPTGTITHADRRPPTAGSRGIAGPVLVRVAGGDSDDGRHGPATLVSKVVDGTRYAVYANMERQAKGYVHLALAVIGCLAAAALLYACSTMDTGMLFGH
jgi:hypothetical protein